jgi:hypothetical protein
VDQGSSKDSDLLDFVLKSSSRQCSGERWLMVKLPSPQIYSEADKSLRLDSKFDVCVSGKKIVARFGDSEKFGVVVPGKSWHDFGLG